MGIRSASERSRFSDGLGRGFMKMESIEDLIGEEWQYTLTSSGLTESFDKEIYNLLAGKPKDSEVYDNFIKGLKALKEVGYGKTDKNRVTRMSAMILLAKPSYKGLEEVFE